MNTRPPFVADIQPTESMQPRERAFDDPAGAPEAAAVRPIAAREDRRNAARPQFLAMALGVVPAIALHAAGFATRATGPSADRGKRIDQVQELADVVAVGRGQPRDERNPLAVGKKVMFRPGLAAIGRVRSSFFPPRNARSEELSTIVRARSRSPRRRNSVSRTVCSRFHTPAFCQRTSRRQQVEPEPHPISCGSRFHGSPLRRTKRMPVSTARSGNGFRPAWRRLRGRRFGNNGSISRHRSSSSNGLVMQGRLLAVAARYQTRDQGTSAYFT